VVYLLCGVRWASPTSLTIGKAPGRIRGLGEGTLAAKCGGGCAFPPSPIIEICCKPSFHLPPLIYDSQLSTSSNTQGIVVKMESAVVGRLQSYVSRVVLTLRLEYDGHDDELSIRGELLDEFLGLEEALHTVNSNMDSLISGCLSRLTKILGDPPNGDDELSETRVTRNATMALRTVHQLRKSIRNGISEADIARHGWTSLQEPGKWPTDPKLKILSGPSSRDQQPRTEAITPQILEPGDDAKSPLTRFVTTRRLVPCAATASMFVFAQDREVLCYTHNPLAFARSFSQHTDAIEFLVVNDCGVSGSGRLVLSYDAGRLAIVWDLRTGDIIAKFSSYDEITSVAWMRDDNVVFGTYDELDCFQRKANKAPRYCERRCYHF
jgi:WD40 repeat protein